jgi:predicted ester cyclase
MKNHVKSSIVTLLVLAIFNFGCQPNNNNKTTENNAIIKNNSTPNKEEEELKEVVDNLLIAAGNYDIEALDDLVSDKAMIAISSLKDGIWSNTELTIDEYFENVRKREPRPYCEIPQNYDIIVTEGRIALVRSDAILHRYGIPHTREVNNFILMKENGQWKFLNISFTVEPLAEENKKFDLEIFARGYAQSWGSKRPEFVASYFAEDGALKVNDGEPAKGSEAISKVAEGFMTAFPDMGVLFDSLVAKPNGTEFHWTLVGTNSGPAGTGKKVKVSGYELWQINEGKIKDSQVQFSIEEYNRQLEFGIDKQN